MPLLSSNQVDIQPQLDLLPPTCDAGSKTRAVPPQTQHSQVAKSLIMSRIGGPTASKPSAAFDVAGETRAKLDGHLNDAIHLKAADKGQGQGHGQPLSDTPLTTAPNTPLMYALDFALLSDYTR